jgi:hypothetical protein
VLLTAGGLYVGLPAAQHPRWPWFLASSGVYGVLGLSALSGHYFGLHVHGRLRERFVGGRREEPLAVEATVGRADGTRVEIVRTTIGLSVALADEPLRCHDLAEALGHFGDRIVSIDSASHNDMELAAELERAGALPARAVVLNGRRWVRRRALTPDA